MVAQFPQTLPANTVVGRLGTGPGPSQAISFTDLFATQKGSQQIVNVKNFGAVGDGNADDTVAINAATTFCQINDFGSVFFPPGIYKVTSQIVVPHNTFLQGAGKRATVIRADPTFPINTPIISISSAALGICFDTGVSNMFIDCNTVAGSIGVYSNWLNEGCGLFSVGVSNWVDTGVFFDSNCIDFANSDWELYATNNTSNYGLKMFGGGIFDRVTVFGNGIGNTTAAVFLKNAEVTFTNLHMESCSDGILVDTNCRGTIITADGETLNQVVHLNSNSAGCGLVFTALQGFFGTPLIKDDITGVTTTTFVLPIWSRQLPFSSPPTITSTSPYTPTLDDTEIINTNSGGMSVVLSGAANIPGRILKFINTKSQPIFSTGSNVIPVTGAAAGTAICGSFPGAWAVLKSDGTNWHVIEAGSSVIGSSGGATRLFIDHATATDTNTGIEIDEAGVAKWSIASFNNGHTNRDLNLYNEQLAQSAADINGDNNNITFNPQSTTPNTLSANGTFTLTPTSNTNFRISYRGSDGVTRVGNITLA